MPIFPLIRYISQQLHIPMLTTKRQSKAPNSQNHITYMTHNTYQRYSMQQKVYWSIMHTQVYIQSDNLFPTHWIPQYISLTCARVRWTFSTDSVITRQTSAHFCSQLGVGVGRTSCGSSCKECQEVS